MSYDKIIKVNIKKFKNGIYEFYLKFKSSNVINGKSNIYKLKGTKEEIKKEFVKFENEIKEEQFIFNTTKEEQNTLLKLNEVLK